ncbi:MAG: hypothetical protein GY715_10575 [Planctomycetes bacterium]|nr:hypothetical protein [Planctomycetota bacterium]
MNDDPMILGPTGRERREAMLPTLLEDLHRVRRVRRRRRAAVAALCLGATLIGAAIMLVPRTPAGGAPERVAIETPAETAPPMVEARAVVVARFVETDHEIAGRLGIDDDTLLTALAEIGRPTGLVRRDGHVRLTRNVVNPPG